MKGYGPTGVSYTYSRGNLIDDLIDGILICEEDFPEEESHVQVPPWIAEDVADMLIAKGVNKGYTAAWVFKKTGDSRPRLYVKTLNHEERGTPVPFL